MDISAGISNAALASTAAHNGDAVTVSVMKRTMNIQASTAAPLIESVAPSTPALPDNLGQNINVTA